MRLLSESGLSPAQHRLVMSIALVSELICSNLRESLAEEVDPDRDTKVRTEMGMDLIFNTQRIHNAINCAYNGSPAQAVYGVVYSELNLKDGNTRAMNFKPVERSSALQTLALHERMGKMMTQGFTDRDVFFDGIERETDSFQQISNTHRKELGIVADETNDDELIASFCRTMQLRFTEGVLGTESLLRGLQFCRSAHSTSRLHPMSAAYIGPDEFGAKFFVQQLGRVTQGENFNVSQLDLSAHPMGEIEDAADYINRQTAIKALVSSRNDGGQINNIIYLRNGGAPENFHDFIGMVQREEMPSPEQLSFIRVADYETLKTVHDVSHAISTTVEGLLDEKLDYDPDRDLAPVKEGMRALAATEAACWSAANAAHARNHEDREQVDRGATDRLAGDSRRVRAGEEHDK